MQNEPLKHVHIAKQTWEYALLSAHVITISTSFTLDFGIHLYTSYIVIRAH